jgi:hypothetical protein
VELNLVHTGKKEYFHKFIIKYAQSELPTLKSLRACDIGESVIGWRGRPREHTPKATKSRKGACTTATYAHDQPIGERARGPARTSLQNTQLANS